MTREEKRLARYAKYNASLKGQQRHKRYEAKHPERSKQWSANMESHKDR